ncbi:MAG: hypothetical protein LC746_16895 [Acidobacteria bacterium]|nr:hypothetical protein [Acidobacteriota bacterium]
MATEVHGEEVQLVAGGFEAWVDDEIDVARFEPAAQAEEAEGEARGEFEARDEDVTAAREDLFDALLGAGARGDVHEVGEGLFVEASAAEAEAEFGARVVFELVSPCDEDGEGGEESFGVSHADEDGGGLAGEDVIGEARGDGELAQLRARGSPGDEERGGEEREDEEEQVVAGVVGGESDDEEDAAEDRAARGELERRVKRARLFANAFDERRDDEDRDERDEDEREDRAPARQLPVVRAPREPRQHGGRQPAEHQQRPKDRSPPRAQHSYL